MSEELPGEPAAWPADVIVPPGYVSVEIKILCIQYAGIKEALISGDSHEADAFWIPLSKIVILKRGEKTIATVPKELAARLRHQ
jgi:hypothetical protein